MEARATTRNDKQNQGPASRAPRNPTPVTMRDAHRDRNCLADDAAPIEPVLPGAKFPANREKNREFSQNWLPLLILCPVS